MKFKKTISCALVLSMLTSALPLASVPASAADTTLMPSNTSGTLTITLTIAETPAPVITLSDDFPETYDGNPKQPILSVAYSGTEDLYLKVDCLTSYANTIDWTKYTGPSDLTNVFAPTNAGTYRVSYFLGIPENPAVVGTEVGNILISRAEPKSNNFTFTAPNSLNYDGNAKTATVTTKDGVNGMGEVTVRYYSDADRNNEVAACINPGTYYVGIEVGDGKNYTSEDCLYDWYDDSWKFTIEDNTPAPVTYRNPAVNETTHEVTFTDTECSDYIPVTNSTTTFEDGKWYVVNETLTNNNRITVNGTANLILMDGKTLTSKGITVTGGNTLNIYAQSEGENAGALNITADYYYAGIGTQETNQKAGTITINGGKVTANGGYMGNAGIGGNGSGQGQNGTVIINGGTVIANSRYDGAGIGGNYNHGPSGTIIINGGTVNATGNGGGAGIGGGDNGDCEIVTIYGGNITAKGGLSKDGEGGGAGIGGGRDMFGGKITINGGDVTATGGKYMPGIGGSGGTWDNIITINNGTVVATGGEQAAGIGGNAAIWSGEAGGNITIKGGTVTANGNGKAAGIGGGGIGKYSGEVYSNRGCAGGTITISGGTVIANGGSEGTGIGGSMLDADDTYGGSGTISITGGDVTANGGTDASAIGTSKLKDTINLTIGEGMVISTGASADNLLPCNDYAAHRKLDVQNNSIQNVQYAHVMAHTHSMSYEASGNTLTGTCSAAGCNYTENKFTLTINAEDVTYDTLPHGATLAVNGVAHGGDEFEIEYYSDETKLDSVPVNAGTYTAKVTLGEATAEKSYTIAPISISSVAVSGIDTPEANSVLDTTATTDTENVTLNGEGAITWDPQDSNAAYATIYKATVTAAAADNYVFADNTTATVNGQTATVTKNQDGTLSISYTFDKTGLTPVTITATDKEVTYSSDGIAIPVEGMFTIPDGAGEATYSVENGTGTGTFDATTKKLTVTKCGTFTVKVSTAASDTHAAGAEVSSTLTVNKADPTVTDPTASELTYTGSAQALVTGGSATGGTMQYSLDGGTTYSATVPTGTAVGDYTVWYKVVGDANHNDTTPASVAVTINQKEVNNPTITLSPESFTYDGTAKEPTVTVKDGTKVIPASEYNVEYSNNTNAGTATVTITDKDGGNYTVSGTKTFTIAPASQSAPAVSSTDETIAGKADGTITNVTTAMEYKLSTATEYTPITGTSVTGLAAGTYNVRYAEKANYNASPATNVVINTGSKITVQFDANGGTPAPASQQFNYNQTVSKPATDPTKTGYTFKFWSADGTAEYAFNTPLTANITLTAVYQVNSYTITFDTDGGSAIAAITKDYGATVTAPADPTKTGYTFDGWDKEIPETMPAEDITIKAQWTINRYTITFVTNSGTTIAPITADYGTEITAPARPTRSGYAFKGWDPIIPATMPAYDLTVTAQWISTGSFTPSVPSSTTTTTTTTTTTSSSVDSASSKAKMWAVQNDDKSSITVGWEKVNGATKYTLYVRKNGKLEKVVDTKKTKVLIKNPANNTNLEYVLKYTIGGVESAESSAYTASIKVYYKPAVKATSKNGAVTLKWNKVPEATKYRVYKYVNGKLVKVADTKANAVRLKNVTTGKTYKYAVKAYVDGKWTKVTKSDIVSVKAK